MLKSFPIVDRFVVFCDIKLILDNGMKELIELFPDYKLLQKQEQSPEGPIVASVFVLDNKAITFRPTRIDVEFATAPHIDPSESLKFCKEVFDKIYEKYELSGNRLSYLSTQFIPNVNGEQLNDLVENLGLTNVYGPAIEFNMRINNPVIIMREKFNGVLTIQPGVVQSNDNKKISAVMFINDINSIFEEKTNRFFLNDVEKYYVELMKYVNEKNEKTINFIESASIV